MVLVQGPAACGGRYFNSERRGFAAASEGLFVIVHSGFKDKDFPWGKATQGIKEGGKTILQVYCFWFAVS